MKRLKPILLGAAALLVVVLVAAHFVVNHFVRERFDAEVAKLEDRLKVRYEGLGFELWSGRIRAREVTATTADGRLKFLADTVLIRDWERGGSGDVVTRMGLTGRGVRIHRRGENGGWIPKLKGYGYEDPEMGLEMDYRYDPETRTMLVERLKIGGREMGAVSLEGTFADVAAVNWGLLGAGTLMQRGQALGSLKVASLELEYYDFGLLPRVFARHGSTAGKSAEEVGEDVYAIIEEQQSLRLSDSMLASIRDFLREPDRIEIAMDPDEPVGTMKLAARLLFRGDLIQLLGVDIRT